MIRPLDRYALFYPMRVVGAYFLIVVIALHVNQLERWNAYHFALVAFLFVHPHVVLLIGRRFAHDRPRIESIAFLVDAFLLGVVVHLNEFSLLPSLILITVALVNGLSLGGFRQMFLSGAVLCAGILAPMLLFGPNYAPKNAFGVNLACSVFLFVYFNFFAYSAYNRSALLRRSQDELQEQKATLEIEKMRSDRLLLNLVPAGLVGDLERDGRIEPRVFDPATLVAVSFRGFSRSVDQGEPREALDFLTHCFQGFDAIVTRHGLEKLKTMGDLYMAVAGLPTPSEADARTALDAALEMRDFLDDLAVRRRAGGLPGFEGRIGVHSGRVVGALVETARFSYDVWGSAVAELVHLHRHAAPGEVLVSASARRRIAGGGFAWQRREAPACSRAGEVSIATRESVRPALHASS